MLTDFVPVKFFPTTEQLKITVKHIDMKAPREVT
jgi:hypothetical protein